MSFNFSKYDDVPLFVPLGGSNEIGMNLNLYRYAGKWLVVDCGIGFADDYLPGVDVIVPNTDFIEEIKENIVGMIITHAHEDHVGAVGYLWHEFECPIYTTPFTAAVLKPKLAEEGLQAKAKVHHVEAGKPFDLGPFTLEMVPITHSIPEMHAIAIRTDAGVIMHTGDWKLDHDPLVGVHSDQETLTRYGDEGVLAMVCDSTNVMVEGESGSESDVRVHLKDVIMQCEQRALVSTFASNIARLESIIYAGLDAGRQIALAGKSLWRITDAAKEAGYLQDVPPFLTDRQAMDLPRSEVLIVCTGCQGESRAALTKIAREEHPAIRIQPGDTIIFSSRVIPGNETKINWLQNKLVRLGAEIIGADDYLIHVSGHPCRGELASMYQWVRPKIAVPVHGEWRHIHEHAKLAKELQVPETVEPENGVIVALREGSAEIVGHVPSGYVAMDGKTMIDADNIVLRTRRKLRDDGCCVVSLVMDKKGNVKGTPIVSAPGSLDPQTDRELIKLIAEDIASEAEKQASAGKNKALDERIRAVIRRHFRNEIGKKPVLDIHIHEV